MNSPPKNLPESQANTGVPTITRRRSRRADHAEIVRMAQAEAASRAAERREMIARAAYFRAEQRGFEPGHELEDWYEAESQIAQTQQHSCA